MHNRFVNNITKSVFSAFKQLEVTRQLEVTGQLKVTNMSFTMVIVLSLILRAEMVYINGTTLNLIKEVDSGLLDGFDCGIPKDISINSLEEIAKCSEQAAEVKKIL